MKVSVIIPVYNAKAYLEKCVSTITKQTYKDIEILLIDDGSTDGSAQLCDMLAAQDTRIRVFHKPNGGVHSARNLGIEKATGEYVMMVDSDDWIDLDTIAYLVQRLEDGDADVIRFNYVREFEGNSIKKENTFLKETVFLGEECKQICRQTVGLCGTEMRHPESLNFLSSVWANIYRRSLICDNGLQFSSMDEIGSFEDGLFNIMCFAKMKKFEFVDKCFYHYRKTNTGALTSNYHTDYLKKRLVLYQKIQSAIASEVDPAFEEAYLNRIAMGVMEMGLNALLNTEGGSAKYREICEILHDPLHKKAEKQLLLSYFPIHWKVYYGFVKTHFTPGVYVMTKLIQKLKRRF